MNKYLCKGAVFDFNGTLFVDEEKQYEAWRNIVEKYTGKTFTRDNFESTFLGHTNTEIGTLLSEMVPEKIDPKIISDDKEVEYRKICRADPSCLHLVKGAESLFDELKKRNMPFTIATASEISNVRFYYETFKLDRWFSWDKIVYDDSTFPGKPAPDTYLKAAELIGQAPRDCFAVEDTLPGIHSAESAGIGVVFARNSSLQIEQIKNDPGIAAVIQDFTGFAEKYLI